MIPPPTGRARARSARARAPPRLYSLAGLRLPMLSLLLPCCCSRCSCSGLSSFPMLLRLFFRMQCSTLSGLSRFPFHDSQVYFWGQKSIENSASFWTRFWTDLGVQNGAKNAPKSSPGAPQDALGARFLPHTVSGLGFDAFWTPWDLGNRAPMYTGARFLENHLFEPGAEKGHKHYPKIDPKTATGCSQIAKFAFKTGARFSSELRDEF